MGKQRVRQGPGRWTIREQVITDEKTGVTLSFEILENGVQQLRITGKTDSQTSVVTFGAHGEVVGRS